MLDFLVNILHYIWGKIYIEVFPPVCGEGKGGGYMRHRGDLFKEERAIRSQLAKLVHNKLFVYGSMATSKRKCGKDNCWCKGKNAGGHVSSYVSVRVGNKRKMIFVPQSMVPQVGQWIQTYKEINAGLVRITELCVERLKE